MDLRFGLFVKPDGSLLNKDYGFFVTMKIAKCHFVFKFRMKSTFDIVQQIEWKKFKKFARDYGISFDGRDGTYLQPIASTLYKYSYLLKLGMK